jgi:hypothetical protein
MGLISFGIYFKRFQPMILAFLEFVQEYNASFKSVAELQEKANRVIEKHRLELEKVSISWLFI